MAQGMDVRSPDEVRFALHHVTALVVRRNPLCYELWHKQRGTRMLVLKHNTVTLLHEDLHIAPYHVGLAHGCHRRGQSASSIS